MPPMPLSFARILLRSSFCSNPRIKNCEGMRSITGVDDELRSAICWPPLLKFRPDADSKIQLFSPTLVRKSRSWRSGESRRSRPCTDLRPAFAHGIIRHFCFSGQQTRWISKWVHLTLNESDIAAYLAEQDLSALEELLGYPELILNLL
jgi:hypothetical protein